MLTESGFFKEDAAKAPVRSSSVPPDLVAGRRIAGDKYELLRKIGVGAMGEVWAARHLSLEEEVAIKLVLRDIQHEDGSTADSRFLLEARVARMLSRKTRHIVSVTDHGDDGDMAYLVMELLSGEPLDTRLARSGLLPLAKVVPVVQQVARALAVAHAEGIVHRDLKPGNVFLTLDEEGNPLIKILDFGIAKLKDDARSAGAAPSLPRGVTAREAKHATLRGFLLGTPAYMSPEQARGKLLDHRADVWALGVITYHLLTAQFPFDGANAEELFKRLTRVQPFAITEHRKDLPPAIAELFDKAFAKNIGDRFQTAESFATALDRAAGNRPAVTFSLPPPSQSAPSAPPPSAPAPPKEESAIVAAGVPRGSNRQAIIAAVVLLALGGAFTVAYGRFGRDDVAPAGLAAGSKLEAPAVTLDRGSDLIPPPEPVAAPPSEPSEPPVEPPPLEPPVVGAPSVVAEPPPIETAEPPQPSPTPPPAKSVDRSQVF
ncbi:MAG: serine/threonine protein kinase [Labilithrix sp.]|nr:serine/threonine protein kinase [Labilithrix sp.]MCW5811120.1 serine/threonine protein kinase [Labilithrix sp.]